MNAESTNARGVTPASDARTREQNLLFQMLRIRRLEEKCAELYTQTKIRGFLHLYIGEEAIAVGVMQSLRPDDSIVATYREHGHALVRGVPARKILAEMYGKQEGCARGRGGSMHLFDKERRFYGGNAIVGGGLPIAVGLALADRMRGRDSVACCFFGEGAMAEGEFHESMNLASLWTLPVLFCCENNLYAMGTALSRSESETDLARHATGYAVPGECVDGMDVEACESVTRSAVEHIRAGKGPYFLEFRTYRFRAHSMFDPERYREKGEVAEWKKRDPIDLYSAALRERGAVSDTNLRSMEDEIGTEIEDAVAFAEAGTLEPIEDLTRFVYSGEPTS